MTTPTADRALSLFDKLWNAHVIAEREISLAASDIAPIVTWGTTPEDALPVSATVPDPARVKAPSRAMHVRDAIDCMGLSVGMRISAVSPRTLHPGATSMPRNGRGHRCAPTPPRFETTTPGDTPMQRTPTTRGRIGRIATTLALAALVGAPALAQQALPWADKPIKLIVGATPGGSTDIIARVVGQEIGNALGTTVIVENRAGAGGNLAADAVAKAPPDGHTLLLSFSSHTINAALFRKLPFDTIKDFTPIAMVASAPALLLVNPSVPANNVAELIQYAKAHPGKLSFGLGGIGSSLHMASEQFKMMADVNIVNVPYKGTAPALADLMGDHVQVMFSAIGNVQLHIKGGKVRLLATTGARRMSEYPNTPTVGETVPNFESTAWWGLFGPADMPRPVLDALNAAVVKSLATQEVKTRFATDALNPVGGTPQALSDFVVKDVDRWKRVVKATGATAE